MLKITPEIQDNLGKAVLVLEDDVLYITNTADWMIVIPNPSACLPHQILKLVEDFKPLYDRCFVDWRVLNAKDVDYVTSKFLPYRARKYTDIGVDTGYNLSDLAKNKLRVTVEAFTPSLYGDLIDLTAMFNAGEARAIYSVDAAEQKKSERAFAKEPTAETYRFHFDNKILPIRGDRLRSFHEMGFTVVCPKELYGAHKVPPLGLRWHAGLEIFGYVMPSNESGVFVDKQGRELLVDATKPSWMTEDTAVRLMCLPGCYSFTKDGEHRRLADVLEDWNSKELKQAVSSLLWKGWSTQDIDTVYESMREPAYRAKAAFIQGKASVIVKELTDKSEIRTWRIRNIETDVKRYCTLYDRMGHLIHLDLGVLPRAVKLLDEALSHGELNSFQT